MEFKIAAIMILVTITMFMLVQIAGLMFDRES